MTFSTDIRYDKIKFIYDEAMKLNSANVIIYHKDPETFKEICKVTPLDLKYLEDIGFIDIKNETLGEVYTIIKINSELIEYIEDRKWKND